MFFMKKIAKAIVLIDEEKIETLIIVKKQGGN